jgi:hypothetical protein
MIVYYQEKVEKQHVNPLKTIRGIRRRKDKEFSIEGTSGTYQIISPTG